MSVGAALMPVDRPSLQGFLLRRGAPQLGAHRGTYGAGGPGASPGRVSLDRFPRKGDAGARIASGCRAPSAFPRRRGRSRARGRTALTARGRRRRHDHAREAAVEAGPGRDRPARRAAPARLGGRVGDEREDDDGRDGRRDPRAHALRSRTTAAGANLVSGVASALLDARERRARAVRGRRGCPTRGRRAEFSPEPCCLGNLFRDQLDRYGELELVAERWRAALARPAGGFGARRERRRSAASATSRATAPERSSSASTTPLARDRRLQHAADSKYCVRCGTPYVYAAAYVGHLGDYRCPACGHSRPPLDIAAREIELHGLEPTRFASRRRPGRSA